jgi:hypothetical protein
MVSSCSIVRVTVTEAKPRTAQRQGSLLVQVALLIGILLVVIIGTIRVAASETEDAVAPLTMLFSDSQGTRCRSVCLLGVDLSKATLDDATTILNAHAWFSDATATTIILGTRPSVIIRQAGARHATLTMNSANEPDTLLIGWQPTVSINTQEQPPTTGQIIALWGAPTGVLVDAPSYQRTFWLLYECSNGWLTVSAPSNGIVTPDLPIAFIRWSQREPRGREYATAWRGFGSIYSYVNRSTAAQR